MFKYLFLIILSCHGLIHLLGFIKAFNLAAVNQLTLPIPKATGMLWFVTALLFLATAGLFFLNKNLWWVPAMFGLLLSQLLIFTAWPDAKYGTVVNMVVLLVSIMGYGTWNFSSRYAQDVRSGLHESAMVPDSLLTEADLQALPEPVKNYLRYVGAVNQPKVRNFKVTFAGQIRKDEQSPWMPFTSEQYNFLQASTRLFFMQATMKFLPVAGYHRFVDGDAYMDIRLFSLFKVQYQSGKEMGIAETVTFFNDMCCMAPATLIDPRVKWLEVNGNQVRASFTNNDLSIFAWLTFNDQGQLINFISEDRFTTAENGTMKRIPWSTPLQDYRQMNGRMLPGYADAIYHYPEGAFCYGNFRVIDVQYNCN